MYLTHTFFLSSRQISNCLLVSRINYTLRYSVLSLCAQNQTQTHNLTHDPQLAPPIFSVPEAREARERLSLQWPEG